MNGFSLCTWGIVLLVSQLMARAAIFGLLARNFPIIFSGNLCDILIVWEADTTPLPATSELNQFELEEGGGIPHSSIFLSMHLQTVAYVWLPAMICPNLAFFISSHSMVPLWKCSTELVMTQLILFHSIGSSIVGSGLYSRQAGNHASLRVWGWTQIMTRYFAAWREK